jgi:hypothetical protein
MSDVGNATDSGEEQQSDQSKNSEQTMSNSQLPSEEETPNRCTDFQAEHPLNDPEDADFAFICPRCEKPNALCGKPTDFANKPFCCLDCNYVSLLDPDALSEFEQGAEL